MSSFCRGCDSRSELGSLSLLSLSLLTLSRLSRCDSRSRLSSCLKSRSDLDAFRDPETSGGDVEAADESDTASVDAAGTGAGMAAEWVCGVRVVEALSVSGWGETGLTIGLWPEVSTSR